MSKVYFSHIEKGASDETISVYSSILFEKLITEEKISFEKTVPIKVHFGEKGNVTYNKPGYYDGIIDFLKSQGVETCYIETNVLYRGERTTKASHIKVALDHGFNQIPVVIADGDSGKYSSEIQIDKKRFSVCKIGKEFSKFDQFIVMSHFKGHLLAGFGGALKNLGMGFASREGKLAQHSGSVPWLNFFECRKCGICAENCLADAIVMGAYPRVMRKKCVGCASCIAVCPTGAMKINWFGSMGRKFAENLAEYAFAAQLGKKMIYINYAVNMTKLCDCVGKSQKIFIDNLGVLASTDPVAIDQACLDLLDKRKGRKVFRRGRHVLKYAEGIGLGKREYELETISKTNH
ncbi:DUF362 domain-containing protein [candidate division WOR-3 bacterium]|nr:DUF362 domain-containing protein [candidate division WOR-3 bacterium]